MTTDPASEPNGHLGRAIRSFERLVVAALLVMMMLVVGLSTIELASILIKDIITPPILLLEVDELLEIFGFFLLILIGVELLETIKAYQKGQAVHLGIVIEVALIAVARKVIVMDLEKYDGGSLLAIAALVAALSVAWAIAGRTRRGDR